MQEYKVKVWRDRTEWCQNGKIHRLDAPAVEYKNGTKYWYQNGKLHRIGGPASEYPDGYRGWYQNGKRHRIDGPACEWSNGKKEYWENGERVKKNSCKKTIKEKIEKTWFYLIKIASFK